MTESGIKTTTQIKIIISKYIYIYTHKSIYIKVVWRPLGEKKKENERGGEKQGIAGSGEQGKKKGANVCGSLVGQLANQIWSVSHEILGEYSIFPWEHCCRI